MIYIVSHKNVDLPKLDGYQAIQVGCSKDNFDEFVRDNTGINISNKNSNYCELTALYWIWKNKSDDYKGLVHYRRFFGKKEAYKYDYLISFLDEYDIVLPKKIHFHNVAKEQLLQSSCTEDTYEKLRAIVEKMYPEYIKDFDAFFSQNTSSLYNMMLCSSKVFDEYCEWLFSILFELEKNINYDGMTDYQKRIFGFLSERLLNIWVEHNNLKVMYSPVFNTELKLREKLVYFRRDITNNIRYRLKRYGQ